MSTVAANLVLAPNVDRTYSSGLLELPHLCSAHVQALVQLRLVTISETSG